MPAFPGAGTPTNPYLIAGYSIVANYSTGKCISIAYTTKHVLISNCYLILNDTVTMSTGVDVYNAANVTVTNNILVANDTNVYGMFVYNTTDVIVNGNQFLNFTRTGVEGCINAYRNNTRLTITDNYMPKAWIGINSGGDPTDTTNNLVIANNYVGHCIYGIQVWYVNTVNISNNLLMKSQVNLRYSDCHGVTIVNNIEVKMPTAWFTTWPVTLSNRYVGDTQYFIGDVSNGTAPFTYEWDFEDPAGTTVATYTRASHKFLAAGTYIVTLPVTDADGDSNYCIGDITLIEGSSGPGGIAGYPLGILMSVFGIGVILLARRRSRVKNQAPA